MGRKDMMLRDYFRDNGRFANVVNNVVFAGEEVLKPDDLADLETCEVYAEGEAVYQRQRDVAKVSKSGTVYVMLGIENQNSISNIMPFRTMEYDYLKYRMQFRKIARRTKEGQAEHKECKEHRLTRQEFLDGFGKKDRIMPVIIITLYYGAEEWNGARKLSDLFYETEYDETLSKYYGDYKINLVELAKLEDIEHYTPELQMLINCIRYQNDYIGLQKMMEENIENFSRLSKENFDIISILIEEKIYDISQEYRESKEEKEEYNMCKAMEDWKAVLLAEGRTEGRTEGEDKVTKLISILMEEKQYDEVNRVLVDTDYKNTLYNRYGIS